MSTVHQELNRCALAYMAVFIERQQEFMEMVGDAPDFAVDLGEPSITFGERTFRIAMLGSSSEPDDTWMWGWANPSLPENVPGLMEPSLWLRDQAERYRIPELTEGEFALADLPDYGMGLGSTVAMAACGLIGARAMYGIPYASGRVFVAIMDDQVALPATDPITFPRRMGEGMNFGGGEHRLMLQTWCNVHRVPAQTAEDGSVTVSFVDGSTFTAEFDDQDRFVKFRGAVASRGDGS